MDNDANDEYEPISLIAGWGKAFSLTKYTVTKDEWNKKYMGLHFWERWCIYV